MPVSTDPLPAHPPQQPPEDPPTAQRPVEQPDQSPAAAAAAAPAPPAASSAAAAEPGEYPKVMVKGENSRRVESAPQEVHLRAQGFRAADDPPVTRGEFLPPVRHPAPQPEPTGTEADTGTDKAAAPRRRRKPATPPTE